MGLLSSIIAATLGSLGSLLEAVLFEVSLLSSTVIEWVKVEQTLACRHGGSSWQGPGQEKISHFTVR